LQNSIDIVGRSRLLGEDEAGMAQAVRERREAAHPLWRVAAADEVIE
jgi:hypothetical protein